MASYTFSDVLFKPQYSEIRSRSNVDISTNLGKIKLHLPIISANMADITGPKMAIEMCKHGGMGILHRFNTIEEAVADFKEVASYWPDFFSPSDDLYKNAPSPTYNVGVSIGIKEEDKERANALYDVGARIFCIDIAHGHSIMMKEMIEYLRATIASYNVKVYDRAIIIAGNIATAKAAIDFQNWGADIVKCGIGPGAACYTRKNCASGVPQMSALQEIREACPDLPLIADGGIKESGDIVKALKFADAVMVGSFIAGTSETPGHVYTSPKDEQYKTYSGSASAEAKVKSGGDNSFVEGKMITVPFKGKVKYLLRSARHGIQSGFSYSGAKNLKEFKEKAEFIFLSGGGKAESKL